MQSHIPFGNVRFAMSEVATFERPVAAFIEKLGGTAVVSERTGHKPGAVRKWKCVGVLPRSAWPEIQKAFPEVSLDCLLELEARQ